MIIHQPVIKENANEISIAAEIEIQNQDRPYPRELWFKFPIGYKDYLTDRTDGFAASLLPLAMHLGEDLDIRGELSYRLAYGLREYQKIQSNWNSDFFKSVDIKYRALVTVDAGATQGAVGSAFSGGVDSFHTLWTHLPQNEPFAKYRITDCLLINGIDIDLDLDSTGSFEKIQKIYEPIMREHHINLWISRTNVMQFIYMELLMASVGAVVTASALVLGRLFSRFYIPSSAEFMELKMRPNGSNIVVDHLLGTETMETIHDNVHLTRLEKTAAIARWPVTYPSLRVCFNGTTVPEQAPVIKNCCRCEKCVRTMVDLDVHAKLSLYAAFTEPLTRGKIRGLKYVYKIMRIYAWDTMRYAFKTGRKNIAFDLGFVIFINALLWQPVHRLHIFSYHLETRSKHYARFMKPIKKFSKKMKLGKGWLYS
jgi:hypothetical protein